MFSDKIMFLGVKLTKKRKSGFIHTYTQYQTKNSKTIYVAVGGYGPSSRTFLSGWYLVLMDLKMGMFS